MALTKVGKEGITGISNASDATAITIDASENVGIGTSSPSAGRLTLSGVDGGSSAAMYLNNTTTTNGKSYSVSSGNTGEFMVYDRTSNAYRLFINAQGRIIQNGTSAIGGAYYSHTWDSVNGPQMGLNSTDASGNPHNYFIFQRQGTQRGSISVSGSATAYNTSSDYRMKENVDYIWDATARLKQLKPARFNFIDDASNTLVDGFLAHEVSSIVPEAITGTKDAMTTEVLYVEGDKLPDGKSVGDVKEASVPDYQGIDQSKLVPLLVKTIQELEARITALEA